jgi:uncharacterized protein (TIGR02265 family)
VDRSDSAGGPKPLEYWLEDLERRRAFVKPGHTVRGMFFRGMLESFRALGQEALVRRCLQACGQERFLDFSTYPAEMQFQIILTALPVLAQHHGSAEAALHELGRWGVVDFLGSTPGKAMLMLTQGRPRPLIEHLPAAYRVAVNFGESQVLWTGAQQGTFLVTFTILPPPFHVGLLAGLFEAVRTPGLHVSGRATGALDVACDFSWG